MIEKFAYLILMFVFSVLPTLYFWAKHHKFLIKYYRIFIYAIIVTTIGGYFWDYIAIKDGIWYFPNILDIWILGIPIEEWLFFWVTTIGIVTITLSFIGGKNGRR